MDVLIEITYEENVNAQNLIEKSNALKNLLYLIESEKQYEGLLKSVEEEYEEVCEKYRRWWDEIIEKYQIQYCEEKRLFVDCEKKVILYQKKE